MSSSWLLLRDAVGAGAVGDVVVDGHGEGVGLLEHHADLLAQPGHVHAGVVDLLAPVLDGAGDLDAGHQVVHPVQGLEEGGLAAAGGADEGGDLLLGNVDIHALQGLGVPVPQVQIPGGEDDVSSIRSLLTFSLAFLPTSLAARLMTRVRIIRMAAMAKATSNSARSLAYT